MPPIENTFHLVGDVQGVPYIGSKANRADKILDDMARATVPTLDACFQAGDFVASGGDANFAPTRQFMDDLGHGQWWAAVGNHDTDRSTDPNWRTPAAAAALMGMPGPNYVVDLDYVVVVVVLIWAWGGGSADYGTDWTWLEDTLDTYEGRKVMVLAHPHMRDVITPVGTAPLMLTADDTNLRSVLAARPWVVAYMSGHTHSALIYPVAKLVDLGAHSIAHINGSAVLNNAPQDDGDANDPIRSLFVTVNDDSIDVRFRDHGAHQWVGGTPTSAHRVTLPITP